MDGDDNGDARGGWPGLGRAAGAFLTRRPHAMVTALFDFADAAGEQASEAWIAGWE
ncbi:MAG: hypothetical protein ABI658_26990 [Acidimicrobiales bacterium]